jgi:hypothetical protein
MMKGCNDSEEFRRQKAQMLIRMLTRTIRTRVEPSLYQRPRVDLFQALRIPKATLQGYHSNNEFTAILGIAIKHSSVLSFALRKVTQIPE